MTISMDIARLQSALAARLNAPALTSLQGHICLQCGAHALHFQIRGERLEWDAGEDEPDVTFYFECPAHAFELLCGNGDVMADFMDGKFRSSGYLLWTFPLLTLFRGGSDNPRN